MKEALPSYEAMMPIVLKVLVDGATRPLREVFELVCQHYAFTTAQLAETLPSGRQTTLRSRVGWAKTYLVKAGLIEQPRRGICLITERGKTALVSDQTIDNHYLAQFSEFKEFYETGGLSRKDVEALLIDLLTDGVSEPHACDDVYGQSVTTLEQIEQALGTINRSLADDLLAEIISMSPRFFEQLVVDLMVAMGYSGSQQDAARTTRYSKDEGIDGIIKEDCLGLDSIYLQAKRYTDKTVCLSDVHAFAGALGSQKARKGVFITTSRFSREAKDYQGAEG